jgi:glycosyltransferase involved in cell wall biosynthesis
MEKKKINLSIAIAVFNEEKNLSSCLNSVVSFADEIIVVDGGSTDKTLDIARRYKATIIKTTNPPIFHINKQKALDASLGNWILQLDADEIVLPALQKEIVSVIQDRSNKTAGYFIPRRNYFWGHPMKKGGLYPDFVLRLVRRGHARFPAKSVHEQIETDGPVGYLKEPLKHIPYRTPEDYWRKADRYTTLTAEEMKRSGIPNTAGTWLLYNLQKPMQTFFSIFIRHKGFLDGWFGFVFAYWSALHYPIAYRKRFKL